MQSTLVRENLYNDLSQYFNSSLLSSLLDTTFHQSLFKVPNHALTAPGLYFVQEHSC